MDERDLIRSFRLADGTPNASARAAARERLASLISADAAARGDEGQDERPEVTSTDLPGTDSVRRRVRVPRRPFSNPMLWLAGADADILAQCSESERAKMVSLGGTLLTTGLLAAGTTSYVAHAMLGASFVVAITIGLFWGGAILNLDRWLQLTMRRQPSRLMTVVSALPRIVLALLVGLVISTPLMLAVFRTEVEAQAQHTRQVTLVEGRQNLDRAYAKIEYLGSKEADLATRLDAARDSAPNTVVRYRTELRAIRAERGALAFDRSAADRELRAAAAAPLGLLERMEALDDLSSTSASAYAMQILLSLLILCMDALPVLVKLMMLLGRPSIYERLADHADELDYGAALMAETLRARAREIDSEIIVKEAEARHELQSDALEALTKRERRVHADEQRTEDAMSRT